MVKWIRLGTSPSELSCAMTLVNGQCFGWRKVSRSASVEWWGVVRERVVGLKDTEDGVEFCERSRASSNNTKPRQLSKQRADSLQKMLHEYFQLDVSMRDMRTRWKRDGDKRFDAIADCMKGMRIVRQDPLECLFSFICSSNNNIGRIALMLNRLRSTYGELLVKESSELGGPFHAFPKLDKLVDITEQDLRDLGFGYRAKYVVGTAKKLQELGGPRYLSNLRDSGDLTSVQKREKLMVFSGVGPKVADCVALFSLDATSAIPVDTHVWKIACRDFDESEILKSAKSVTPKLYERVGDLFRDRFGPHAGWAHSLMFAAELPLFRKTLPQEIQDDMLAFEKYEKELKQKAREEKRKKKVEKKASNDAASGSSDSSRTRKKRKHATRARRS